MESASRQPLLFLVEDSEDDAFFFRWALKKSGFACPLIHEADGAAAIARLQAGVAKPDAAPRPDLLFLDLKIPNFSGFEVLAWIRDQRFNPTLPVLVLSGSEHTLDIQRATDLGAAAYYVKPLSVEKLRARIAAWHDERKTAPQTTARTTATSA